MANEDEGKHTRQLWAYATEFQPSHPFFLSLNLFLFFWVQMKSNGEIEEEEGRRRPIERQQPPSFSFSLFLAEENFYFWICGREHGDCNFMLGKSISHHSPLFPLCLCLLPMGACPERQGPWSSSFEMTATSSSQTEKKKSNPWANERSIGDDSLSLSQWERDTSVS